MIGNLSDSSFIVSTGLEYAFHFDAWLEFDLHSYLGQKDGEYTFHGDAVEAEVSIDFVF